MSRPIKFRVWHRYVDSEKWKALSQAAGDDKCPEYVNEQSWHEAMDAWSARDKAHRLAASTWRMSYPDRFACDGDGFGWLVGGGHSDLFHMREGNQADDSTILEQWTGLLDLDGHEIYEGDIIRFAGMTHGYPNIKDDWVGAVVLENTWCGVKWINRRIDELWNRKVIGNIHQNPELLKP